MRIEAREVHGRGVAVGQRTERAEQAGPSIGRRAATDAEDDRLDACVQSANTFR